MAKDRSFFNRRLHSLLGVVPVGLFLIVHLTANFQATGGPEAFKKAVNFIDSLPFVLYLEIFLIWLPILFHAVYGVYIAFQSKHNPKRFSYMHNIMFTLQRFTGLFTFIFIAWHVWETRVQRAFGAEVNFDMMANILDTPWMLVFYIVGLLSAVFHFCNGLWTFLITWGITIGPRAQRISYVVCMALFVVISTIGISALLAFANPDQFAGSF